MQYPSREAEILRRANDIAAGLAAHDGNREAAI